MFDKITNGPSPSIKASQGIVKAALAQRESRAHKASRVELNNHVYRAAQNFNSRPRLVAPPHRTLPLADFMSAVCACVWRKSTNGTDAVCSN